MLVGALVARFLVTGSVTDRSGSSSVAAVQSRDAALTAAALEFQVRARPDSPELLARLGVTYLSRYRETADPSYLGRAAAALERSRDLDPSRAQTLTGLGMLALARHNFASALEFGTRSHELDPGSADALGVVVDAHVELGQYEAAATAAQRMVDRRPSLASYSRVSYVRELHGDVDGAVTAMTQAVAAGAGSPADVASVESLLGDLYLGRGDLERAEAAYRRAGSRAPVLGAPEVGLAKVSAARGDLRTAISRMEKVVNRLPEPASVALLGNLYGAAGRPADAAAQYDLVRRIEELNRANGVAVDLELARFEADHAGDPGAHSDRAVDMARAAMVARPTIFASDTLGWALHRAGRPAEALPHARDAVRLGTADGLLWYHLAAIEADLGLTDEALGHMRTALSINSYLTTRDLPAANTLAERLETAVR